MLKTGVNMSVYIALGANLSSCNSAGVSISPKQTFEAALIELSNRGLETVAMSGLWQSPAWPAGSHQPDYINACTQISTPYSAKGTLEILHEVEALFGRTRNIKNEARPLDLDLLDFKGEVISDSRLQVPHPRMLSRAFVLFPLSEVAPHWTDPIEKRAIRDWIARLALADVDAIKRLTS